MKESEGDMYGVEPPGRGPANILIVEDSQTQAQRLGWILTQHGYVVRHAGNGRAALDEIRAGKPSLVISDVVMPEMNGYELCARIKEDPALADIPVILVTTLADPGDVIRGLECRADNFILKPYDEKYLISRVQFVLVNRLMRQSEQGGLAVDIFFNGQRHTITADRLQILNLLLSTYDAAIRRNKELTRAKQDLAQKAVALAERQRELDKAHRFLEHLIAASPSIIFRLEPDGEDFLITYVSPNIGWGLGYSPSELIGVPHVWWTLIHPDDREEAQAALRRALQSATAHLEMEYRCCARDTSSHWFRLMMCIEYDEHAGVAGIVCHALDNTERRRSAEALQRSMEEADQANRAKSAFVSRMSHDLRTPLNAIIGFAQLMEMDSLAAEHADSVQHILRGGEHLLALINEVLDLARIEAGRLSLSPEPIDVRQQFDHVVDLMRPLAAQRSIALEPPEVTSAATHLNADRQRLNQILLNLLSNAIKYNRIGGTVRLSCEDRPERRVRISVHDTGPGIPAENLAMVFEPFERVGAQDSGVEGTGLGLALARALAGAMGGSLGVESVVGQGSVFWLDLPAADPPGRTVPASPVRQLRPTDTSIEGTVLYVEDNPSNRRLMERIVALRPALRLVAAESARQGLALAHEVVPDLILLDVNLPDMRGEEVLQRLGADSATCEIPVAILSADATEGQKQRLLARGARAYLTKPINVADLLQLMERQLSKPRSAHAPAAGGSLESGV